MAKNKKNHGPYARPTSGGAAPAAEARAPENAGTDSMVTVAYNSPRGMLFPVRTAAGGEKRIHINGSASHLIGREKGVIPVGRYGYTRIRTDEWDVIRENYGGMAIFRNGLIFAERSGDRAADRAGEQAAMRHGLEPVDSETARTEEATPAAN